MSLSDSSQSCSPSLASSVDTANSFTLPSPSLRESDLVVTPPQSESKSKFTHRHFLRPHIIGRRMSLPTYPRFYSASPPPSPPNRPQYKRDIMPQSHSPSPPPPPLNNSRYKQDTLLQQPYPSIPRYHPYIPRGRGMVPPALHYAARSLGVMTPNDVTLEEVKEVRCIMTSSVSYLTLACK
jgi:hypothetical protein